MNIINNTTPILIKLNNKKYKLMYITYEKDNSIYVTFPRKKGYILSEKDELEYRFKGENTIVLRKCEIEYESPKISFHPRDLIAHVKSFDCNVVNKSYKLDNMSDDKNKFLIPFLQVVFPNNFDIFDEYIKEKYKDPLEIELKKSSDSFLSIEIFIHSNECYIFQEDLPLGEKRILNWMLKYTSNYKYACTLVGSEIKNIESFNSNQINVVMNNNERALIFKLIPKSY
jgi:hypothetical protein